MKTNHSLMLFKTPFITLLLIILAVNRIAHSAVINWTNTLGGNWSVAANWNPNQVPGSSDTANITTSGSYAVTLDVSANVNSLVIGGAGSGVQVLHGSGFILTATNGVVNSGGILSLTNSTFYGSLTVASSGVLSVSGENLDAQLTVENGGQFLLTGFSSYLGGGSQNNTNYWLWVQSGGLLNAASSVTLNLYATMTNAGLLNFTNEGVNIYNNGTTSYNGGLLNQSGGVLNLISTAGISGAYGYDYLLNQGTINVTNGNATISVDNVTNVGTVATLPGTGTLRIGSFNGLGSLAGTFNAAAGTVIQFLATANPGTSAGAGLALDGSGQFQFTTGLLTLPLGVIPNLNLTGGNLVLGPGFQGGAITNLTLDGINLTTTLPVTNSLVMTNGTLSGTILVTNGAVLNVNGVILNAQVTVASGGQLLLVGSSSSIGQGGAIDTNYWLWVQSGGLLSAASTASLNLYAAMTNAGLLNFTNEGVNIYNNGTTSYNGGLLNQSGGVLNLISAAGISGAYGYDYLLNQGTINVTNGNANISLDNATNSGTLDAGLWTAQLQNTHLNLQPAGSLEVAFGPAGYGRFSFSGNADLDGNFEVSLIDGYIPAVGSSNTVLTGSSLSGAFTGFSLANLLPAAVWQPVYSSTALSLVVQPPIALLPSGTNLVVNLNGTSAKKAILLTSTNVTVPLPNWTPVATNTFDVTTYLSVTNGFNPSNPRQFFTFKLP